MASTKLRKTLSGMYDEMLAVSGPSPHIQPPVRNSNQNLVPRSLLDVNSLEVTSHHWNMEIFAKGMEALQAIKLGVRIIGSKQVGMSVSALQEDLLAALHSIRQGDRILYVSNKSMIGVTGQEVYNILFTYFAPTNFARQKSFNHLQLSFHYGDIFYITDTLFDGTVGFWQATRVYSAANRSNYGQNDNCKGSVERLQLAQYAPIVIFIDVESRSKIRDLRSKAGASTTKVLMEQTHKIKKH
ncbi:unnamed protein product [Thelazia callipaeda]|uniref:PDZ domain-containing protein n=1 Tax=Thelazia callipaeda TaxID=103827 RepID=A0A0N5D9Z6_THECL|nr:unnamed protein product [Thelazia callipaeda]